jgi:hypothetical protein
MTLGYSISRGKNRYHDYILFLHVGYVVYENVGYVG